MDVEDLEVPEQVSLLLVDAAEDVQANYKDILFVTVSALEVLGVDDLGCGVDEKCDNADRFANFCTSVHATCD